MLWHCKLKIWSGLTWCSFYNYKTTFLQCSKVGVVNALHARFISHFTKFLNNHVKYATNKSECEMHNNKLFLARLVHMHIFLASPIYRLAPIFSLE